MTLSSRTRPSRSGVSCDSSIRAQFKKRLAARLAAPHVPSARLSGLPDCYKIKLRDAGYRLVYQVCDNRLVVVVIAVGKRDHDLVYNLTRGRV
jgi:mRNA interferase RelE/StbE